MIRRSFATAGSTCFAIAKNGQARNDTPRSENSYRGSRVEWMVNATHSTHHFEECSFKLPQGGDNARGARVVLPWALLGPSLRDFDPRWGLHSPHPSLDSTLYPGAVASRLRSVCGCRDNGNVVAWWMMRTAGCCGLGERRAAVTTTAALTHDGSMYAIP